MSADGKQTRTEHDSMGEVEVPAEAMYGAQTARAVQNFPISGERVPLPIIHALALLKRHAAEVNADLGVLDADRARGLTDADGVSMAQALTQAGRRPEDLGPDPDMLATVGVFVELHVEQGRAMIDLPTTTSEGDEVPFGGAVAIGTDIWPHGRWRIDLPGRADHAGTTALGDRDDALLKAADLIGAVRAAAAERDRSASGGERTVATVGKLDVQPGGINAIASHVTAWLDARGSQEPQVRDMVERIRARATELGGTWREESWTPTTRFDAGLLERMRDTLGAHVPLLGTGAGHDAGILANHGVPSAMLFVHNPTGTSHSPEEFAERDDCLRGVAALAAVLEDLAG